MDKTAFDIGVEHGLKEAAFGAAPAAGALKSIGGVTKKFVDGKWTDVGGQGLASRIAGWFGKSQEPTKVVVRGVSQGGGFVPRLA